MKKMIFAALLVSTATLGLTGKVYAAEDVYEDKIVTKEAKTDVGIQFQSDGPISSEDGPFADHLAIVFKPVTFNFGKDVTATVNDVTYKQERPATVAGEEFKTQQSLVVNDDRKEVSNVAPGTAWTVKAKYSGLTSIDANNVTTNLASTIKLDLDAVNTYHIGDKRDPKTNDIIPNDPSEVEAAFSPMDKADQDMYVIGGVAGSTTSQTVALNENEETVILARQTDDKSKTGGVATKINNVTLNIVDAKGKNAAGKAFKGSVTWKLSDTYQP